MGTGRIKQIIMFTLLEKQTIFNLILDFGTDNNKLTVSFLNNVATELGMSKDEFEDFRANLTNLDQNSIAQGINGIFNNSLKLEIYERIMGSLR